MSGKPFVFVLDKRGNPLMPCTGKRAKLLLTKSKARIVKVYPFTIRLVDRLVENSELQHIEIKIDPGSKFTGLCVSRTKYQTVNVLNLFELEHRGQLISSKLAARAMMRRNRRTRNTRYRKARYLNRTKPKSWLPPSLQHRIDTTMSWINKFISYLPVTSLAVERVKFDMQKLRDPEISGVTYQQGTLFQYEVTEYLLEKWSRQCAYCGVTACQLEKEHIIPKARGGTNAVSNLTLACKPCNLAKGTLPIEVFLAKKPDTLKKIKAQLRKPLAHSAAVNATRNALFTALLKTGLPVAIGTGGQTKYNRIRLSVPKTHALDAACVSEVNAINNWDRPHIAIKCNGRGQYKRTILNKYGFPKAYLMKTKRAFNFATGDMCSALIKIGKEFKKIYIRIGIRSSGCFSFRYNNISLTKQWHMFTLVQRNNGYSYLQKEYSFLTIEKRIITLGI